MLKKNLNLFLFAGSLVVIAVLSRLLTHTWNFTIMGGVAIFSAAFFAKRFVAFTIVIASLLISDAVLGFHSQMPAVYFSFLLMAAVGSLLTLNSSRLAVFATSVFGSLLFFMITNFFVWYQGTMYPMTVSGLGDCYVMGIPFYRAQLLSDILSTFALFELAKSLKSFISTTFDTGLVKIQS